MSNTELKIGIIGCGGISRMHKRAYESVEGARIVQVFDTFGPNAEALAKETGATIATSLEAMAQNPELDAVSICTPPGFHLDSAVPFLRAGIPILCEKPFESNLSTALELEAEVRQSSSLFMIAFCHRFNACVREAKRLLIEEVETIGRPLFFRNLFGGYVGLSSGHRSDPSISGGGVLIDNCSHSLDLFRFLMGEIESVQAQTRNLEQHAAVEDFASIDVTGRGAFSGQIASSYSMPVTYNSIEIYCAHATIVINYGIFDRPNLMLHSKHEVNAQEIVVDESIDQFAAEIGYFLDCVRSGTAPSPGIEDALSSAYAIDSCYRSANEGRVIVVPQVAGVLAG